ncbi:MAG: VanZ family protein [Gammaproteobacteria bacterium]
MYDNKVCPWIYSVLLAAGTVLLFLGGPDYYSSRSFRHFWDLGHVVYFALLATLLFRWRFVARMSLAGQWTVILVITLLLGISIELMQHITARTPEIGDVLRDITGSLIALVFGSPKPGLRSDSAGNALRISVLVLLLIQLWPLTRSLVDEAFARHQFPVLSDLETPFEIDRWAGDAVLSVQTMPSISRGKLLQLSLSTDKYSGAALNYFDGDWTSFNTLKFSLYNPDSGSLRITCRIHDLQHADGNEEYEDRFNRSYLLTQGWNHIEIDLNEVKESPANRRMHMSLIRVLGLFVTSLQAPRIIYLDNVRLSP